MNRVSYVSVWARKALGKVFPEVSMLHADWSVGAVALEFERSLRRLDVDAVDLLFLHEPADPSRDADSLLDWLERQRKKGTVHAWGLAGEPNKIRPWLANEHPLAAVLQVRDSLERREADVLGHYGRQLQLTYGYLSAAAAGQRSLPVAETLRPALMRNRTGSVLVSTRKVSRVLELAEIAEADRAGTP
jgi:aryl-alcohol dehydrogenase-like predicted oxidoreductase